MILFCFIIWEAGCKGKLFFMECAVGILRVYCFEELEIILPKLFYSLTAKLIVFLMFDLFQFEKAAIHYAAEGGHLEIIALLIKNEADANVKEPLVRKIG